MESRRYPKRERKAPVRYVDDEPETSLDADFASQSDDEVAEQPEPIPTPPAPKRRAGAVRRNNTSLQQHATATAVPRGSSPPTLTDLLPLEEFAKVFATTDSLHTPVIVARDIANLSIALCAGSATMQPFWRALAASFTKTAQDDAHPDGYYAETVRKHLRKTRASTKRVCLTSGKETFRLTEKNFAGLSYVTRDNPLDDRWAPMKLYNELELRLIAIRKYGTEHNLREAKKQSELRGAKTKHSRQLNKQLREERTLAARHAIAAMHLPSTCIFDDDLAKWVHDGKTNLTAILEQKRAAFVRLQTERAQRREEAAAAIAALSFPMQLRSHHLVAGWINTGLGALDSALTAAEKSYRQQERENLRRQRQKVLDEIICAEGLGHLKRFGTSFPVEQYLQGKQDVQGTFARYREYVTTRADRERELQQALKQEGFLPSRKINSHHTIQRYMNGDCDLRHAIDAYRANYQHTQLDCANRRKKQAGLQGASSALLICVAPGCNNPHATVCTSKVCGLHQKMCQGCPRHKGVVRNQAAAT